MKSLSVSVRVRFQDALPEEDVAARRPGLCAAGAGHPPLMAHPSVHHRGRVAASGAGGGEASAGEASRSRPPTEQHLLSRQGLCGKVRSLLWNRPSTATRALTSSRPRLRSLLARNGCVCEGESGGVNLPFAQLLFPRVSAQLLHTAFDASELEEIKQRRAKEYQSFQKR